MINLEHSLGLTVYKSIWVAADWLFPPVCSGCGRQGFRFCPECTSNIIRFKRPSSHSTSEYLNISSVQNISDDSPSESITAISSFAEFSGPLRKAIHHLKHQQDAALADLFATMLFGFISTELGWNYDLVTSIPLGKNRQKERGFNQVDLIAFPLALHSHRRFHPRILARTRETESQVGKSAVERKLNIAGAFRAKPEIVDDKSVLILDDVITTGATMNACADALQKAGASRIFGLSLAKTVLKNSKSHKINEFVV